MKMNHERRYFGKYKGFVRDNADPEKRGRIRVFCPQVMGPNDNTNHWLGWAEPCFPWFGGLNTGDFGSPLTRVEQIQSEGLEWYGVWVEFEDGIPDFPIWIGTFTIAPLPTARTAHTLGSSGGAGQVGGGLIGSASYGSQKNDAPLNPPQAEIGREVRMRTRKGVDIVIGSEGGGYLIIGPSGVHLVGPAISLNGAPHFASSTKVGV